MHSQTTKITNKLVITSKSPVCGFICALDARQNNHLYYTSALLRELDRPELKVKKLGDLELKNALYHKLFYQIALRDPLQPECSVPVEVEIISTHQLTLHKYTGNLNLFSPYSVTQQTIIVLFSSRNVDTKTKPATQSVSTINYGTFEKKSPFSQMHFENNNKFFTLTRLERVIEISH